ncbi:MAG TPA: hypothetical protein VFU19_20365 [Iamia sp.]|nr:hypothetical protein [Iamia sp.]
MASDDGTRELVELRPAPAVLLRHRDADLEVHTAPRTGPRVELKRGALWIRAGEEGPGVTVTHGATSVQVRAGAGVVEVVDMEALLVVAAGRAAVKGVSPLPRSVIAGQAVTLTLDGTFSDPDALSAAELAADRMVVENLALDNLASGSPAPSTPAAPAAPAAPGAPDLPAEARVDPPGAPQVEGTADPFAPRVRPDPSAPVAAAPPEAAPVASVPPVPAPDPPAAAAAPTVAPAPEVPAPAEPDALPPAPPVGRPAPSLPVTEPSALEVALAGVGVTDTPPAPGEARTPVEPKAAPAEATGKDRRKAVPPRKAAREAAASTPEDDRRRQRILIALVLGALLILAIVAALAFSSDSASALGI